MEGVALLDVISQVKALPEGTQVIEVHVASPGGFVEEGDNIYNYLESLKKNFVVNTVQDGNIASIATKLFLVGQSRIADRAFDFMIHNPWNDPGPGDSNYQADILESLLAEEEKLRKFYADQLDITQEGIGPLMDQETTLTADQLITLGFATSIKTNIKVMAMRKSEKSLTLYQRVLALAKNIKGDDSKAFDVPLMDGTVLTVDAPNEDSLIGAAASIDGKPAPDGDYVATPDADDGTSATGDTITVKGGVVTAVTEPAAALAKDDDRVSNLEKSVSQLTDAVSALVEASKAQSAQAVSASEAKIEAKIMALRSEIGTGHLPKKGAAVYASTVATDETSHKSIAQVMFEKQQARRKQINGN